MFSPTRKKKKKNQEEKAMPFLLLLMLLSPLLTPVLFLPFSSLHSLPLSLSSLSLRSLSLLLTPSFSYFPSLPSSHLSTRLSLSLPFSL